MSLPRLVGTTLLALAALCLAALVVSLQFGLAAEYGADPGSELLVFVALPLGFAVAAAACAGGRAASVVLVGFCVLTLAAFVAAAPLGLREKERHAAERDATFACNGPNSEFLVPAEVDEGWDDFVHPFRVHGPISQSRYGCTAAIDGPVAETWGPWRRSLLEADWAVERDDASGVTVTNGVLRAALREEQGLAALTMSTVDAGACEDGGFALDDDGTVSPC